MSESAETLREIRKRLKGRILLVGRKIGQDRFDPLAASLRLEAKPHKYPVGGKVIAWETGLLGKFSHGDFDSIILHRFLYKPVKVYIEDPLEILAEAKRILSDGGVLVVNSFLLDDFTRNFRAAESFYRESEMMSMLEIQDFKNVERLDVGETHLFVCEK
jgi:SAM-dependent methyltransferase